MEDCLYLPKRRYERAIMTDQEKRLTFKAESTGRQAVVLGGSMAGLLAARVLTDYFDQVTLIERDALPEGAENRKGVPQGRHLHVLLTRGEQIISRLFPGLTEELSEGGATRCDIPGDVLWYQYGGYKLRFQSGISVLSMSRTFLEAGVRRRVLALPNLRCLDQCDVKELLATADHSRITGVRIQRRESEAPLEEINVDLVVDATGRGSQSPRWLESLGYPRPSETAIQVGVGYTTRAYRQRPGCFEQAKAIFTMPTPPLEKRGGVLFPMEGGRWMVTLAGWFGESAPTDEKGFLEYARSFPALDIYNVIRQAEPLTDFATHKLPSNLRRHYEKMERFPAGYLVIGDAICSFNPVYGQGMTVSALGAEALKESLELTMAKRNFDALAQHFFKRVTRAVDHAWTLAVGEDLRYPEAEGPRLPGTDLVNWYLGKVHRATLRDREISTKFFNVMTMTHSPLTLFKPSALIRVLNDSLNPTTKRKQGERGQEGVGSRQEAVGRRQ
jgi:2-polyprenyl-6-methoxyphenol hydroxylase-like FAD-dependent oxidoreductase